MDIHITIAGLPAETVLALAPQVATIAVTYLQGNAPAIQAPPGTSNQCQDEGCELVGDTWRNGIHYLVYYCSGHFELYKA
jgi:hypothetical protein